MTENNKDRYQQIYQQALKAYPPDKKSTVQRKACDLWNIVKEKEKQDKSSTIFKDTLANLRKECLQSKSKIRGFWASLKTRPANSPKAEPPPMFVATETNVADNAIELVDDRTTPGSRKESGNKRDHKKETQAQNKLRTELGEINDELASDACIRERTRLSDEYKKRVEALTSKNNEVGKKLKRKVQDVQSQQQLREKKKNALEKLTQITLI